MVHGVYSCGMVCRVSTRDDLKLMDVGAGKAAMSKVVPDFPPTVRYVLFTMCRNTFVSSLLYRTFTHVSSE